MFNTTTVSLKWVRVETTTGFTWVRLDDVELVHGQSEMSLPCIVMRSGRVVALPNDETIYDFFKRATE